MEKLKDLLSDLVTDHWLKALTGVLLFVAGRFFGKWRARKDWQKKEFMNRLMVSLNSIAEDADGKPRLLIRTLLEKDIGEVLLNRVAVDRVLLAATKTTASDPLLPIETEDRWFILNAILNEIAERFAEGTLARDQGRPVSSQRYLIALTNEIAGNLRTHKIRAMVVRKDLLLAGAFEKDLRLESPHHSTRIETLARMRQSHSRTPDLFLEMEIALAVAPS